MKMANGSIWIKEQKYNNVLWIGKSPDNCRNGLLKRKDPWYSIYGVKLTVYNTLIYIRIKECRDPRDQRREVKSPHAKGSAPYTRFVTPSLVQQPVWAGPLNEMKEKNE
jgi:hypothetical protein